MADDAPGIIRSLGVTPEQLIGYAYTGFLCLACLAIVDAPSVKGLSDAVGSGLLVVIALAAGVAGFTFYFRVVGEILLFPMQYFVHHWLDRLLGRKGEQHTATLSFLHSLGVPWLRCHAAYQEIKANFYPSGPRTQIQLTHGELHVLYVTATTLLGFSAYAGQSSPRFVSMLFVGLATLAAAILSDTIQQSIETHALSSVDRSQLLSFLRQKGLIPSTGRVAPPTQSTEHPALGRIGHVGVLSNNLSLFESFWCDIVGFRKVWESELSSQKAQALFGVPTTAKIVRYSGFGDTLLEVHVPTQQVALRETQFFRFGFNHLCIEITDRERFVHHLPSTVGIHRFDNPGGWENVFIRDFDGNWLEVRQSSIEPPGLPALAIGCVGGL